MQKAQFLFFLFLLGLETLARVVGHDRVTMGRPPAPTWQWLATVSG